MPRSLVALGSNLGPRARTLERAVELLRSQAGISNLVASRWHETPSIGGPAGQGAFLNGAVAFDTSLAAGELHAKLQNIEDQLGRERKVRWDERTIDLDLLLYGDAVIDSPKLTVPHPRMGFRRFVLEPAAEVAAELVHPTIGWTVARVLAHLDTAPAYVALLGVPGSGKTSLAQSLAAEGGCRYLADPAPRGAMGPADLPSHAGKRPIEFLVAWAAVLDVGRWPFDPRPVVSDFYFDQSLAYAKAEPDPNGFEAVRRAWEQLVGRVIAPKLLVVLDAPLANETSPDAELRAEMAGLAARRGIGPVLHVGNLSPEARHDEVRAAMAAMQ